MPSDPDLAPAPPGWPLFCWVALALCAGTMGTALASPLYPLYQERWHLTASTITLIFVAYMVAVLGTFVFLGRLSDRFGPLPVLRAALVLILAGMGLSAAAGMAGPANVAAGLAELFAGRAVIGIASGLIIASATAGLVEVAPPAAKRHASLAGSITSIIGFGLGPLAAGLMAQFAPAPLLTSYVVVMLLVTVVLAALCGFRATRRASPPPLSLRPRFVLPAPPARPGFWVAALTTFSVFAIFSLFGSLAPSFLKALLHLHGPAISGSALALFLLCSAGIQFTLRHRPVQRNLVQGLAGLSVGVGLLAAALETQSSALFIVTILVTGAGHGMAFMAALATASAATTPHTRAGILSSFFSVGYLGTILPVLGVGFLADHFGLAPAVLLFCLTFALLSLGLLVAARRIVAPAPNGA
ncbi:hypothetical protein OTERR_04280 [Oryzomicrobium terrae]|uniref:Major facilitator superfamily (MFS) profile domain-containing protein n=1 Tax=Oryzomicrobium terrae TaxID=1735038 RepID=A0A5C1E5B3_9RHOO|nr:MFS transporter [Oryzomicrobium terrae]QEL63904.1 hypothetical protein OTERR_04280 [Oryzomicrobium terrae]